MMEGTTRFLKKKKPTKNSTEERTASLLQAALLWWPRWLGPQTNQLGEVVQKKRK